ncbi:LPXTG cell wall anchor domain-containing protein [Limosilactobacillus reuteri]|nr:LPXTG cell wall anchor domain-containing protein [Limosilactobacillus reuteri]
MLILKAAYTRGGTGGNWHLTGLAAYELGTADNGEDPYPNASRALTIEGNGHTLNMGKWFISLWDKGDKKWNLTLKDLTINSDGASHSPFYFYQWKTAIGGAKGGDITYDSVTANVNGSPLLAYGKDVSVGTQKPVNVTLKGNNNFNINMNTGDSAISAFNINVADNANINFNVKDPLGPGLFESYDTFTTNGSGDNAIYLGNANEDGTLDNPASQGNFTMGKNSKLVFNKGIDRTKEGHNLRFLYGQNYHGNVILKQGATLDLTMGSGHSVAIQAGNLQIDKDATLSIDTWQNNNKQSTTVQALRPTNDYYHYGPITLGMPCANYFGTVTIPSPSASYTANIDGTLRIIRNIPKNHGYEGVSPLIVYGNMYPNSGSKFYFNVGKNATLDMQDSLSTAYANHVLLHTDLNGYGWIDSDIDNVSIAGFITMFGTSSENHIKIDSPKYVNFQRIGDQIGNIFRTEGTINDVTVTGGNDSQVTIAQWNKGNDTDKPNNAWQINNMYNQMNGGNYSANFLPVGEKQGINHSFGYNMANSNSTVTMAPSMGGYTYSNGSYYYTDPATGQKKKISPSELKSFGLTTFTNQFNWWSPRRITLYSASQEPIKTTDADKYQPETQEVTTHVGTKLAKVNLQDGIKDLLNGDGSVYQDHAMIIGANSAIDWTKSHWGFDWSQTPWSATTDTSKLNKVQKDEYQVYQGMAATVAKTDNDGGLLATNDQDTLQVATIVYQDGSVDFVFVPIKVAGQSDADKYHFTDANIWVWSDKLNLLKSGEVTLRTQEVWRAFSNQVRANKMSKAEQRNTKLSWTGKINSTGLTEPQTVTLTFGDGSTTNVKVAFLVLQLPDFKPVFLEPGQTQSITDYLNLKENPTDGDIIGWTNAPTVPDQPGMYTVWVNLKYQVPTKYKFNRADTQALQAGVYILNTDVKLITGDNAKVLVTQDNKGQVTQLTTVTNDNQMTTYRQQNDGTFKDDQGQQFGVGTQEMKLNTAANLQDLSASQLSAGLNNSLLSGTHYTIEPVKLDKNQLTANLRFALGKNSFIQLPVVLSVADERGDAKEASIIVQFTDDQTGQVIKTVTKKGKPGEQLDFTTDVPDGYYSSSKNGTYTVTGQDQRITIDVAKKEEHSLAPITDNKDVAVIDEYQNQGENTKTKLVSDQQGDPHEVSAGNHQVIASSTTPVTDVSDHEGQQLTSDSATPTIAGDVLATTTASTRQQEGQQLPQTGNDSHKAMAAIGLVLASVTGLIGVGARRKNED